MKKSEVKNFIKEEIQRLFEVKYMQTDNLRMWLSADKKTIYLDNVSNANVPQPIGLLIKSLQNEFSDLMVVNGNNKWIKNNDDLVVIHSLNGEEIDEKRLQKIFKKEAI